MNNEHKKRCSIALVIPVMPFKNCNKITTHGLELLQLERLTIPSANEDAEQLELPYPVGETANWYGHLGKQFGSFLYRQIYIYQSTQLFSS